ncbi:unnamed protein product [Protopolystoma xenopodis]|uniref:Uncharacterized protein n=1 Tax=Protopolystoma xenopodis TaxID=117903 RepID=A0A3S5CM53_9PLAT|nr:unnamed protein product [Protopolystoma xenopodis]
MEDEDFSKDPTSSVPDIQHANNSNNPRSPVVMQTETLLKECVEDANQSLNSLLVVPSPTPHPIAKQLICSEEIPTSEAAVAMKVVKTGEFITQVTSSLQPENADDVKSGNDKSLQTSLGYLRWLTTALTSCQMTFEAWRNNIAFYVHQWLLMVRINLALLSRPRPALQLVTRYLVGSVGVALIAGLYHIEKIYDNNMIVQNPGVEHDKALRGHGLAGISIAVPKGHDFALLIAPFLSLLTLMNK